MKRTYPFLRYGALLSTILFLTNCTFKDDINELKDTIDDFTVYLTTPEFNTGVHFEFVDARTNEIIDDKDVTVTVSGQDAALLYNNIGSKQESYTSNWGTLDLIVDPHKADSASLATTPIQFTVTASLEGYSTQSHPVSIYTTNMQKVQIALTNINNPPEGVTFTETEVAVTTTADGKLTEDLTIEIGGEAAQTMAQRLLGIVPPDLSIRIPEGTNFFTDGVRISQPINQILLRTEWFIAPPPPPTPPIFPHFLYNLPTIPSIGFFNQSRSHHLLLYGISGSQQLPITSTSSSMSHLQILFPSINPNTGESFLPNDMIQRYNPANNTLRQDTLRQLGDRLAIQSPLNNNLNGPQQFGLIIPFCSTGSTSSIVYEFADPAATGSGTITTLVATSDNKIIANVNTQYGGNQSLTQHLNMSLPQGGGKIILKSTGNLKFTPETIVVDNFCDTKIHRVKVESATPPAGQDWINLNIDVSVTAESNSNFVIKPTLRVYYGTSEFTALDLKNGKASLQITEGTEYKIRGAIGNTKAQGRFKVESEGPSSYKLTFTEQLTSGGSGAVMTLSVPKTANNEVTLKYVFPVSDDVLNNFK